MFTGMANRLNREISAKVPTGTKVRPRFLPMYFPLMFKSSLSGFQHSTSFSICVDQDSSDRGYAFGLARRGHPRFVIFFGGTLRCIINRAPYQFLKHQAITSKISGYPKLIMKNSVPIS